MLILSVDSTATPASVCLYDGKVVAEYYIHTGLTHSQTLTAMIDSVLKITATASTDVDCYAVNSGPGSFTGVRIGVSAVKGMAYAADKPCVAVSTLESMAYHFLSCNTIVCACMDARRQQVYNALFRVHDGALERLCEDRAIGIAELTEELASCGERIVLVGDGAQLVFNSVKELNNIALAPENLRYQRASSTAMIADRKIAAGESVSAATLMPTYLRLSQAERERNEKRKEEST